MRAVLMRHSSSLRVRPLFKDPGSLATEDTHARAVTACFEKIIQYEDPRAIEIRATQSGHAKPDICAYRGGAIQSPRPGRSLRPMATKRYRGDCGLLKLRVTSWNDTNADSIGFASSRTFLGQRSGAWNSVVCAHARKSEITLLTLYGSEAMGVPTG